MKTKMAGEPDPQDAESPEVSAWKAGAPCETHDMGWCGACKPEGMVAGTPSSLPAPRAVTPRTASPLFVPVAPADASVEANNLTPAQRQAAAALARREAIRNGTAREDRPDYVKDKDAEREAKDRTRPPRKKPGTGPKYPRNTPTNDKDAVVTGAPSNKNRKPKQPTRLKPTPEEFENADAKWTWARTKKKETGES